MEGQTPYFHVWGFCLNYVELLMWMFTGPDISFANAVNSNSPWGKELVVLRELVQGEASFYWNVTITFLISQKRGKPEDDQGNVKIPRLLLYTLVEQTYEDRASK